MKKPVKIILWTLGLCGYYCIATILIKNFAMLTAQHLKSSFAFNYPALIVNLVFECTIKVIIPLVFIKTTLNQSKNELNLTSFMHKTKDFGVLMLYPILFFLVLPKIFYGLDIFFVDIVPPKYNFAINLIFIFSAFCIITTFFLPMIITKTVLDKNLNRYLTYFFDHLQYPTIILTCFVLFKVFFDTGTLNMFFYDWCFYSVYLLAVARKFIKPVYKQFWYFYYFCTTCFIVLFMMFVMYLK